MLPVSSVYVSAGRRVLGLGFSVSNLAWGFMVKDTMSARNSNYAWPRASQVSLVNIPKRPKLNSKPHPLKMEVVLRLVDIQDSKQMFAQLHQGSGAKLSLYILRGPPMCSRPPLRTT